MEDGPELDFWTTVRQRRQGDAMENEAPQHLHEEATQGGSQGGSNCGKRDSSCGKHGRGRGRGERDNDCGARGSRWDVGGERGSSRNNSGISRGEHGSGWDVGGERGCCRGERGSDHGDHGSGWDVGGKRGSGRGEHSSRQDAVASAAAAGTSVVSAAIAVANAAAAGMSAASATAAAVSAAAIGALAASTHVAAVVSGTSTSARHDGHGPCHALCALNVKRLQKQGCAAILAAPWMDRTEATAPLPSLPSTHC
ncbi:secreted protein [Panicum miliaceum]|uniref:Secreted protein n=1 Tax=Panicum miliaceum TaxID=4540 RepID=A0A3L6RTX9_PANMI|nr:secreted protein [Panicum miliaceum]